MTEEQISLLAELHVPTYMGGIHLEDRRNCTRQMIADLRLLATKDGCIAAAWAVCYLTKVVADHEAQVVGDDMPVDAEWIKATLGDSFVIRDSWPRVELWRTRRDDGGHGFRLGITLGGVTHVIDVLRTRGDLRRHMAAWQVKGGGA